jgi:hypothetical protein
VQPLECGREILPTCPTRRIALATILSWAARRNSTITQAADHFIARVWTCDGHTRVRLTSFCIVHADVRSIYKEIGPGKRVALSKLAVEKFEETGRPLRIAIDTSIWLFQIQASKGMRRYALRITRETDSDRWH